MKALHEFLAVAIDQAAAFPRTVSEIRKQPSGASNAVGWNCMYWRLMQRPRRDRPWRYRLRGAPRWVRRMKEDAPKPTAREDCLFGQDRKNLSRRLVENIGTDACQRPIDVRGLDRVMRRRQQIHGGSVRDHFYIRVGTNPSKKRRSIAIRSDLCNG